MSTILIIEDSPTLLNIASKILEEAGHTVITAMDGEQAVQRAIDAQPDLVLLDVILPGYNGFQVCRVLKSKPETSSIPVVMLTSKDNDRDREWGMAQGAEDYIVKPFKPETLLEVVARFVKV
jgi:twitching motility two-component system response regulator PilH